MQFAHDSGFRAIVLSAVWKDGASAAADVVPLRLAVDAAVQEHVRPVLAVYQRGRRAGGARRSALDSTPLGYDAHRALSPD